MKKSFFSTYILFCGIWTATISAHAANSCIDFFADETGEVSQRITRASLRTLLNSNDQYLPILLRIAAENYVIKTVPGEGLGGLYAPVNQPLQFIADLAKARGGSKADQMLSNELIGPGLYELAYQGVKERLAIAAMEPARATMQDDGTVLISNNREFQNASTQEFKGPEKTMSILQAEKLTREILSELEVTEFDRQIDEATGEKRNQLMRAKQDHLDKRKIQVLGSKEAVQAFDEVSGPFARKFEDGSSGFHFRGSVDWTLGSLRISPEPRQLNPVVTKPADIKPAQIRLATAEEFRVELAGFIKKNEKRMAHVVRDMLGDAHEFLTVFALEHQLLGHSKNELILKDRLAEIKERISEEDYDIYAALAHSYMQINDSSKSTEMNLLRRNSIASQVVNQLSVLLKESTDGKGLLIDYQPKPDFPVSLELIRKIIQKKF